MATEKTPQGTTPARPQQTAQQKAAPQKAPAQTAQQKTAAQAKPQKQTAPQKLQQAAAQPKQAAQQTAAQAEAKQKQPAPQATAQTETRQKQAAQQTTVQAETKQKPSAQQTAAQAEARQKQAAQQTAAQAETKKKQPAPQKQKAKQPAAATPAEKAAAAQVKQRAAQAAAKNAQAAKAQQEKPKQEQPKQEQPKHEKTEQKQPQPEKGAGTVQLDDVPMLLSKESVALRRRRRGRQILGAVVSLLVIIGIFSTISGGVRLVAALFDDTEERAEYASRLEFLVALDPIPFNSISEANTSTLLSAAILESISGAQDADYEHDEVGAIYLPVDDLRATVSSLYGPNVYFNYITFEDNGLTFNFDAERQAYLLPVTSATADYAPVVEKITREGNTKRVTVGYVSQYNSSGEPVKYNDYIFTRVDGQYYLTALVASEMRPEATAVTSTAQAAPLPEDPTDALNSIAPNIVEPESLLPEANSAAPESVPQDADTSTAEDNSASDSTSGSAA